MAGEWLVCTRPDELGRMTGALRAHDPGALAVGISDGARLREILRGRPRAYRAAVGFVAGPVSDVNLAAALAHDGCALEVALVREGASGSLRSRARQAGIDVVLEAHADGLPPAHVRGGSGTDGASMNRAAPAGGGQAGAPEGVGGLPRPGEALPGGAWDGAAGVGEGEWGEPADGWRGHVGAWGGAACGPVPRPAPEGGKEPWTFGLALPLADEDEAAAPPAVGAGAGLVGAGGVGHAPDEVPGPGTRGAVVPEGQGSPTREAPVVVFCSGRGGVGKTAIVACAASVAASWGLRVVALDLDLALGNLGSVLGDEGRLRLSVEDGRLVPDLATELARLAAAPEAPSEPLVVGPCERPEYAEAVSPHVEALVAAVRSAADLVLVDTSSTVTDAVAAAMQACDRLVVVSDDQPGGLASVARVAGLAVRLGLARTRILRLENCSEPREDESRGAEVPAGLEVARVLRVAEGGMEVADLAAAGRIADAGEASPEFHASVASCLAQLLSELGRLPDVEAAREARDGRPARRRWRFAFGGRRSG